MDSDHRANLICLAGVGSQDPAALAVTGWSPTDLFLSYAILGT